VMRNIRNNIRAYFQPAFLICVAILTTAGAGMSIAVKSFGVYLKKEPLPLKKSFHSVRDRRLHPVGSGRHRSGG